MYKLYYALKSASMGMRVLLEEIGTPYELIETVVDKDTPRPPEQLAINPNGWVCLLYTSPSPRDKRQSRMPSSA